MMAYAQQAMATVSDLIRGAPRAFLAAGAIFVLAWFLSYAPLSLALLIIKSPRDKLLSVIDRFRSCCA